MSSVRQKWLTPPEFAAEIGVNVHAILGWIKSAELIAHDLRRPGSTRPRWRLRPEDVEAFLSRRRSQPQGMAQRQRRVAMEEGFIEYIK